MTGKEGDPSDRILFTCRKIITLMIESTLKSDIARHCESPPQKNGAQCEYDRMLNRYIFDMLNIFSFHSLSIVYKNLSFVGTKQSHSTPSTRGLYVEIASPSRVLGIGIAMTVPRIRDRSGLMIGNMFRSNGTQ